MDIFSEKVPVRFGNIDRSDTLTLSATFDFFQEAAISHAEILGVGRDAMKRTGMVWVLSRIGVFMERRPRFGEMVTVRSWPRGSHKLFAVRDYDIRDAEDRPVVRGRSGWLILDIEKRRPLRPQMAMQSLPLNSGVDSLPGAGMGNEVPAGLIARPDANVRITRNACYSDIDYNGHMNNTRYIQWIQDMLDPKILESARQIRLDINYLSEVKPGEAVDLCLVLLNGESAGTAGYPVQPSAAFAAEGRRGEENVFRAELRTGT
jgi:acyl-ACP thioesterase